MTSYIRTIRENVCASTNSSEEGSDSSSGELCFALIYLPSYLTYKEREEAGALMQNNHEEIVKVKKKRSGDTRGVIIMEINKFPSNYTFYRNATRDLENIPFMHA